MEEHPALALYYWVNIKVQVAKWDRLEMMKLSDLFDFSFYERHPEWQTKEEWTRIQNLYTFLNPIRNGKWCQLKKEA